MDTIRFTAVVDQDQVIRLPYGIEIPCGEIEVTVKPLSNGASAPDAHAATRDWLLALAQEAERSGIELPGDLAERHDHYAHGKPLP